MNVVTLFVSLVSSLGLGSTLFTFFYDYNESEEKLQRFTGQLYSLMLYLSFILGGLIMLAGPFVFPLIFKSDDIVFYPFGCIAVLTGILNAFYTPFIVFLRNRHQLLFYTFVVGANYILTFGFQIIMIVYWDLGVFGGLLAKAIGMAALVLILVIVHFKYLTWKIDFSYFTKIFRYLRYQLPDNLFNWFNRFIDVFILERLMSLFYLDIFFLLNRLTSAVTIFYFAVKSAILPELYEAMGKEESSEKTGAIQTIFQFYLTSVCLAVAGIVLIVSHIDLLIGNEKFHRIIQYAPIYTLGFLFEAINTLIFLHYHYYKNARRVLMFNIAGFIILVWVNLMLIPKIGLWGAVIAHFSSRLFILMALFWVKPAYFDGMKSPKLRWIIGITIGINLFAFVCAGQGLFSFRTGSQIQFVIICLSMVLLFYQQIIGFIKPGFKKGVS